jgi:uncharacterized RDD family membrane protein YckC
MQNTIENIFTKSSRRRRIFAFLIDHTVITFVAVAIDFLIMGPKFIDNPNIDKMTSVMFIVLVPTFIVYFGKDLVNGISLGRWVMGIMVRDENDYTQIPSRGRLVLRNLFLILWPIEFVVLMLNNDVKRLGDKFEKTVVLVNPQKAKRAYRVLVSVAICTVAFGFVTIFSSISIKSSEAYAVAIQKIKGDKDILKQTAGIKELGSFPTGNINITNGFGKAAFKINIVGVEQDLELIVFLQKEPNGRWNVTEISRNIP